MTHETDDSFRSIGLAAWLLLKRVHRDRKPKAEALGVARGYRFRARQNNFGGSPEKEPERTDTPAQVRRFKTKETEPKVSLFPLLPPRRTIRRRA